MKKNKYTSTSPAATSIESSEKSIQLAENLCHRILDLARRSGQRGITINEAEELISDHKASSVSPRFSELVRRGELVRVLIGYSRPSKRFPHGIARYLSRFDEDTRRNVAIHWLPEFAPKGVVTPTQRGSEHELPSNSDDGSGESGAAQAVYL